MKNDIYFAPATLSADLTYRNIRIPSRFFLAPINPGLAYCGQPTKTFLKFYQERSGKKIGITYIGNVAIGKEWVTNSSTPYFSSRAFDKWKELSATIKMNGSLPGVQLACRLSRQKPFKGWLRKDLRDFVEKIRYQVSSLPIEVIDAVVKSFIDSARLSVTLGFQVVQIHAAHGYFLSQLLNPNLNTRKDHYGIEPVAIIEKIVSTIKAISNDIIVDLRLSLMTGLESKEKELERQMVVFEKLYQTSLDMISISNGFYDFNKHLIYPSENMGHACYLKYVIPLAKKYPFKLWNVAGNIWDLRLLPQAISQNLSFSLGRALIADPCLIQKSFSGEYEHINWCPRKDDCHYYSKNRKSLFCPFDPSLKRNAGSLSSGRDTHVTKSYCQPNTHT